MGAEKWRAVRQPTTGDLYIEIDEGQEERAGELTNIRRTIAHIENGNAAHAALICAAPLIPECEEVIKGLMDIIKSHCEFGGERDYEEYTDADTLLSKLKAATGGE